MKVCCRPEKEMAVCHCLCSDEANDCNISFRNFFVMMTNLYLFINSVIKIKLSCKSPHQCNSAIFFRNFTVTLFIHLPFKQHISEEFLF